MTPTLYITIGLPASGKTYFTERLARDLGMFFLNGDGLRLAVNQKPTFSPEEHARTYALLSYIAGLHLEQGLSVICNANYHLQKRRRVMAELAASRGAGYQIIWVQVPYEVARERIISRAHEIPPEKMVDQPEALLERMNREFEKPGPHEPVIIIDGTRSYEEQYQQFQQAVGNPIHSEEA